MENIPNPRAGEMGAASTSDGTEDNAPENTALETSVTQLNTTANEGNAGCSANLKAETITKFQSPPNDTDFVASNDNKVINKKEPNCFEASSNTVIMTNGGLGAEELALKHEGISDNSLLSPNNVLDESAVQIPVALIKSEDPLPVSLSEEDIHMLQADEVVVNPAPISNDFNLDNLQQVSSVDVSVVDIIDETTAISAAAASVLVENSLKTAVVVTEMEDVTSPNIDGSRTTEALHSPFESSPGEQQATQPKVQATTGLAAGDKDGEGDINGVDADDDDDDDLFGDDDEAEAVSTNIDAAHLDAAQLDATQLEGGLKASTGDPSQIVDWIEPGADAVTAPVCTEDDSKDPSKMIDASDSTAIEKEVTDSPSIEVNTAIPRKSFGSSNGSASPISKKRSTTYTKAALIALGLPDNIHVPYSVDKDKLLNNNPNNRKMMDTLRALPVKLINDALTEYDDAVQVKGNTIRNHGAYLYGVVKRYVAVHERAVAGGDGTGVLPMGDGLTVAVHSRLEQLVSTGFCTREEMNDKVKSKIKMLPEKDALFALDELSSVSRSQIRNFGSYFMGILNRYMRGDHERSSTTGATSSSVVNPYQPSSPAGKMTNQYHNNQFQQQQRGRDRTSMFRDSTSQPSFSSSFSNNNDRDRSRDRSSKGSSDDHNNRRFSRDQNQNNSSVTSTGSRPPYDTRQQQVAAPAHQQPSWQQNPSLPLQQQQTRVVGYQNAVIGNMGTGRPSGQQEQQQSGLLPGMANNNYAPFQPQQQQFNPVYQQQPNASNPYQPQQQNPSNPFVLSQNYPSGQQQQQQPQLQQYQQQQPSMVGISQTYNPTIGTSQQQQPYVQQQQFQLNLSNQQQGQINSFSRTNPSQQNITVPVEQHQQRVGGWQQSQQPQTMLPVDIMGLADKAASAVQALSSVTQMQNRAANTPMLQSPYGPGTATQPQQQQVYNPHSYQQPQQQPMYGVAATGSQIVSHQQYPLGGQLQGTPTLQQQPSQSMQQQHYTPSQPPAQQLNSYHNHANPAGTSTVQDSNRRRTTASLTDLPHGVQYAIQNLIATRAIEGQPDDGILGMIHDLPEALAIASLQKFATLDKNNMRNRTAYLAGVLRRELEKIQRR